MITMDVRLPILGKAAEIHKRDKQSILNKGYLLNQNAQKYTSQRNRVAGASGADIPTAAVQGKDALNTS